MLASQQYQVEEAQLVRFLRFCSDHYDKPNYLGRLPAVQYDADARTFVTI